MLSIFIYGVKKMITWEYVISQLPKKTFKCSNCKNEIEIKNYSLREPQQIPYHDIWGEKRFMWEYDILPSSTDNREYVAYWRCPHCNHINYINVILLQHYNKIITTNDVFADKISEILSKNTKTFEIFIIEESEDKIKMTKKEIEIPVDANFVEIPSEVLEILNSSKIKKIQIEKSAITFVYQK